MGRSEEPVRPYGTLVRGLRTAAAVLLTGLAATACGAPAGHPEDDPPVDARNPEARAAIARYRGAPAQALAYAAWRESRAYGKRLATARRWGLADAPLMRPPAPAVKPRLTTEPGFEANDGAPDLPPVITKVPTTDRVIFLTIDDGNRKDPELIRMMSELDIPYSAFLSDFLAREDYGYFHRMRDAGVTLNNHTINHPNLRLMSYEAQRAEICGQQSRLEKEFGTAPRLFRPPFGNYNGDSLRAAKSCGVEVVPLWQEEAFADHWDYRRGSRHFEPGDIVLIHFRGRDEWPGEMPDVVRLVLKKANEEGFALARLEDYI
ncbi:hypothetical protein SRB5_66640 [Streptomyces sp. RB5]|uniref:NodB homology domain-containing protein n=1 Tax=Streptomyces smaragdinus TaxID=2585196 RepID=A0A7K0CSJ6_9ACTN|nr:polysaccharide deacetylase family protein [Streptomyces smaragdinus]MQY16465.1 hypothetical protein [Streptomyces smaragdinus]